MNFPIKDMAKITCVQVDLRVQNIWLELALLILACG